MKADASLAIGVQDNVSQAMTVMRNAMTAFRKDVPALQKELTLLSSTKVNIKMNLDRTQEELRSAKKAFRELGESATEAERAAAEADWKSAEQNYENLRQQMELVSHQARETQRDMEAAQGSASRNENRGGFQGGGQGVLSALAKAGMLKMAGDVAGQWANSLVGSAFGSDAGGLFSGALSGAASGAAMGSVLPGIGTAVGAAIGGGLGLLQGAGQIYEQKDDAFRSYNQGIMDTVNQDWAARSANGSAVAPQRELDAIAFNKLLGQGVGDQYLSDLRAMAATTPMEYGDLTGMSRALTTGFGGDPDRMLDLMQGLGDAGSAVGLGAPGMTEMAKAMSRMQSTDLAQLGELNMLQDRGINVFEMLGNAMDKSEGEIRGMISRGQIGGRDAVGIIQAGLEENYAGAMDEMAKTFPGLSSTLSDAKTEIDAAYGSGLSRTRSPGMTAQIEALSGPLGADLQQLNGIIGEAEGMRENLKEQVYRDVMNGVLNGAGPTEAMDRETAKAMEGLRTDYLDAMNGYALGDDQEKWEAGTRLKGIKTQAEALALNSFQTNEKMDAWNQAAIDTSEGVAGISNLLGAWKDSWALSQSASKGRGGAGSGTYISSEAISGSPSRLLQDVDLTGGDGKAYGLRRVPYNNYAALLHQGERVLTAQEARRADAGGGGSVQVSVTGNEFTVRNENDLDAIGQAIASAMERKLYAGVVS